MAERPAKTISSSSFSPSEADCVEKLYDQGKRLDAIDGALNGEVFSKEAFDSPEGKRRSSRQREVKGCSLIHFCFGPDASAVA